MDRTYSTIDIRITGLAEARNIGDMFDYVVSIIDSTGLIECLLDNGRHFIIQFDDIAADIVNNSVYILPEKHHIDQILEFTKQFKEGDRVLIHCSAGISRSTAIALLVLIQHGMSPSDAMDHVHDIRSRCWPNAKVVQLGDGVLNCNGEMVLAVDSWKRGVNPHHVDMSRAPNTVTQSAADEMQRLMNLVK